MTDEQIVRQIMEWWRAGERTGPRLITLADHYAFQYRRDPAALHAAALAARYPWEREGES